MQDIVSTGMFVTGQLKVLLGLIQDLVSSGVYYAVLAVNVRSDVMQKLKDLGEKPGRCLRDSRV